MIRRFMLSRSKDISGVSGIGKVAEGCLFMGTGSGDPDECVVHWFGSNASLNIYHSIEAVLAVHGHAGCTEVVWLDPPPEDKKTEK
jgi:hypothetical protein